MALFLAALVAMPLPRPELDVRARWVGEYALGAPGGLTTGAYVALGVGAPALAPALRACDHRLRRGATLLASPEWKGLAGRVLDAAWTGWMLLVAVRLRVLTRREPARVT